MAPEGLSLGGFLSRGGCMEPKLCEVDDCSRPFHAKNLCKKHYYRVRRNGSTTPKYNMDHGGSCGVSGCLRGHSNNGLCSMHAERVRRTGSVGPAESMRRPRSERYVTHEGYVRIWVDGKQVLEHRHVMETILGRPLTSDENVHHKNGDRGDNNPTNLEVWSKKQPPGQRVRDKIAWAREILAKYEDEEHLHNDQ